MNKSKRVSSSTATGGAGTIFEQHVGAYWLAQLLVHGIPPIIHDCVVNEVHFQTEHLGWNTDDLLIIGQRNSENNRKLAGQVKRSITISSSNDEFKNTIQDFWHDFKNDKLFSKDMDRLAIITLQGTKTLLKYFSGLLDCSRASRNEKDFEHRLTTKGFINEKAIKYCNEIRKIISEIEGRNISCAELWPFLRVMHVLNLDLGSSTRQTEVMIKSLLAYTANEQNTLEVAEESWNALLHEVGEGMTESRSYKREDLPELLIQRHSRIGLPDKRILNILDDHSRIILDGIRSTIGNNLHISRSGLIQQILEELESNQVVLVSGVAGSGKSVIAKEAIRILSEEHFTFSFRAEEFSQPHFDATLNSSQIPANTSTLGAILSSQGRKILLIESIERLLEKTTRDAFSDLLTLMQKDRSWRLVLTCRDYSTDLVRSGLLGAINIVHSVVNVPLLNDNELKEVGLSYPILVRPLENSALRRVLRNPYFLDRALQIRWSIEKQLPQNEKEFRVLFWRDIVRSEHRVSSSMAQKREDVFIDVALKRARALSRYVHYGSLSPEVINDLRSDSLIVYSRNSNNLVAPAHDVLEDWAIMKWIEEQFVINEGDIEEFSNALGAYPAIRRSYRKWVAELVEVDPNSSDKLFRDVLRKERIVHQFRDDTLVSFLRSASSVDFLERHASTLFANDKQLLIRVIHLLRVACVKVPDWMGTSTFHGSLFILPEGPAWSCVLRLVQKNIKQFAPKDYSLLLGFLDDWSRGVSWQTPYPEGAEAVAAIANQLLPSFDNYQSRDQMKNTLRILAKIPKAENEKFCNILKGRSDTEKNNRITKELRDIICESLEGMAVARDMPELLIDVAKEHLLCFDEDIKQDWRAIYSRRELETVFGVKGGTRHDFFPASAYQGPFIHLLRFHMKKGIDFIIEVCNHSADWYSNPRVPLEGVEPPFEIVLLFGEGTTRKQWCNSRLWNLYRGTSVGPYFLQSLLMALEKCLLDFAEEYPGKLDKVLTYILKRSKNAALTAVVASVATAFPHASVETLLVLLKSPICIRLDLHRVVKDSDAPSKIFDIMPQLDAKNKIFEEERKQSDSLPHRKHHLETAIVNLQLGTYAHRVHEILDKYREDLPPMQEQDEDDRLWRLAIHRMDLRQYKIDEHTQVTHKVNESEIFPEDRKQYIPLILKDPDDDVKEMVEKNKSESEVRNTKLGLLMWGLTVFRYEKDSSYDPVAWREKLQEAMDVRKNGEEDYELDPGRDGPGIVAAVCVRDHWEEMSDDERIWCVDIVCSEVENEANRWEQFMRVQRNSMSADRSCAWVIPLLIGKSLDESLRNRVIETLKMSLTHAINEVRWFAVSGVGKHLWTIDRELTLRCVNALAVEATMVQHLIDKERNKLYEGRRKVDDIEAEVAAFIRQNFFDDDTVSGYAYDSMDINKWFSAEANGKILSILVQAPNETIAINAFERLAQTLTKWWDLDEQRHKNTSSEYPERNHEIESVLTKALEEFVLKTNYIDAIRIVKPIVNVVNLHSRKVQWFIEGLIAVEDRMPNIPQFWALWAMFADAVRNAKWLPGIDDEYSRGREVISAIFLGNWWKEEVRHWRSLEGYSNKVHNLFEELPPSVTVLDMYVNFLYQIGEQSLPESFIRISRRLQQGNPKQMLRKSNTVFMLEVLLQRYVYGKPLELKRQKELREAVLFLLDTLVEQGSSAAFRMRDDFVTPIDEG